MNSPCHFTKCALMRVCFALTGFILLVSPLSFAHAETVSKINVAGNSRVQDETIESYLLIKPGQSYTASDIDDSLKALYSTGLFSDVKITKKGGTLVVQVEENPVVRKVAFEGNSKLEDEQLASLVQTKSRDAFSRTLVESDTLRIIELYRRFGRYNVKVAPKVIKHPGGRVDVVYEINEGKKARIESISFIGNNYYSDGELLDQISTTESNLFSFLKSSDVYDPDRLDADKESIRRFYLSHGFADFRILSAVADFDREAGAFYITFNLSEGKRYAFGKVSLESAIPDIKEIDLKPYITIVPGDTYSLKVIEDTVEKITLQLSERGYVFSQVRPAGERNVEAATIDVSLQIDEGPRVYVERININGNTATQDYVIRREFQFAEGDAYNQTFVDRAQRRLNRLGYFKSVKISREPGSSPDKVIVNVDVVEQNTGKLSFGAGYSSSSGFSGTVSIEQNNFLGRGQKLKLASSFGKDSNTYTFSFTEPRFLGSQVAATIGLHNTISEKTNYEITSRGGSLSFSLPITENVGASIGYSVRNRNVKTTGSVSRSISDIEGSTTIHDINYSLRYARLDDSVNPLNGISATFTQKLGSLGTTSSYIDSDLKVQGFKDLGRGIVLNGLVRAGHIGKLGSGEGPAILDTFFFDKDLVRGFRAGGLGPRDLTEGANKQRLGGTTYFGATAELQMPIWGIPEGLGLSWALFADVGTYFNPSERATKNIAEENIWNPKLLRSSIGASLMWRSPVGPLRFDFSKVLKSGEHDETETFSIGQSTTF